MPYLASVRRSDSVQMSTSMHYRTTLTATWVSGSTYKLSFSITREEERNQSEKESGTEIGWDQTYNHWYRILYIQEDGNIYDSGEISLNGTPIQVKLNDVEGEEGWTYRTATIPLRSDHSTITVSSTNGKVIALYRAIVDNRQFEGGTVDYPEFWTPGNDISKAELLPGGPNVLVRSGGEWKRAKDIWVYRNKAWRIVPSGHLNVYTGGQWKK